MKSAGNRGVIQSRLQVLHVHVFLVAPLGARHMARPPTDPASPLPWRRFPKPYRCADSPSYSGPVHRCAARANRTWEVLSAMSRLLRTAASRAQWHRPERHRFDPVRKRMKVDAVCRTTTRAVIILNAVRREKLFFIC